jgi:hypothetical protein
MGRTKISGSARAKAATFMAFSAIACAYSLYRGLEFAAIASLAALGIVAYKGVAIQVLRTTLDLASAAVTAKYQDLEPTLGRQQLGWVLAASAPFGMRGLLSTMTSGQIGRLMALHMAGGHDQVIGASLDDLRGLRRLGLITQSGPSMAESATVAITDLGRQLSQYLLSPPGITAEAAPPRGNPSRDARPGSQPDTI